MLAVAVLPEEGRQLGCKLFASVAGWTAVVAPSAYAISAARSVLPESTTKTSHSSPRKLSKQASRLTSSL